MDESDAEEDRLEAMLARHQQRNVSDWGSSGSGTMSPRKRRRGQQPGRSSQLDPDQSFEMDTTGTGINSVSSIPTAAAEAPLLVKRAGGLLLPGHVEILPEEEDGRGDDDVGDCKDTNAEGEMGDFVLLDGDRSGVSLGWQDKPFVAATTDTPFPLSLASSEILGGRGAGTAKSTRRVSYLRRKRA